MKMATDSGRGAIKTMQYRRDKIRLGDYHNLWGRTFNPMAALSIPILGLYELRYLAFPT